MIQKPMFSERAATLCVTGADSSEGWLFEGTKGQLMMIWSMSTGTLALRSLTLPFVLAMIPACKRASIVTGWTGLDQTARTHARGPFRSVCPSVWSVRSQFPGYQYSGRCGGCYSLPTYLASPHVV